MKYTMTPANKRLLIAASVFLGLAAIQLQKSVFAQELGSHVHGLTELNVVIVNQNVLKLQVSMDNAFTLHVAHDFNHLAEEESAVIFAHASEGLAQIEEEAARNVLEENVNEVGDFSSGWFLHVSI